MKRELIWGANVAVAVAIAGLLAVHFRRPSLVPYERALERVADAVEQFRLTHGRMPGAIAELPPSLATFRGAPVAYTNLGTTYVLSVPIPAATGPKMDERSLPQGAREAGGALSMEFWVGDQGATNSRAPGSLTSRRDSAL